jgi:hypothetical protein
MVSGRISGIVSRVKSGTARAWCLVRGVAGRWLGSAALACFTLSCSDDTEATTADPMPGVWIGEVRDTDVKVALADRDGAPQLFFCGGDASYTTHTRWFAEGALLTTPFSFSESGWSVTGVVNGDSVSGTLLAETETTADWMAAGADSSTIAGLYEGIAPCGKLGLIVMQRAVEEEPTGQGACLRDSEQGLIVEQVNPVRLAHSLTREISVTVASAPDEVFTVRPVVSAEQ